MVTVVTQKYTQNDSENDNLDNWLRTPIPIIEKYALSSMLSLHNLVQNAI